MSQERANTAHLKDPTFEPTHPSHLYLHHKNYINHQYEDLIGADPAMAAQLTTGRLSPSKRAPAVGAMLNGSVHQDGTAKNMTEYEKWWYTERDRIAAHLEAKNSPDRSLDRVGGQPAAGPANSSPTAAAATISPVRTAAVEHQQQRPVSQGSGGSSPQRRLSSSPSRATGVELNPSHLYLHHRGFVNHYHEPLLKDASPASTHHQKELSQSIARSPPRGDEKAPYAGLTTYEQWWYAQRDSIAAQVAEKAASVPRQ